MSPMNFLTVELLTLFYPLFLFSKNIYSIIMIIIIIEHGLRLEKNFSYVNKEFIPNFTIFILYIILTFGLFYFQNFVLFGILYGILQYLTYIHHEKQSNEKYTWFENWIDIPITIMSSIISYTGFKKNNLLLVPFLGDVVYHILEMIYTRHF